MSTTMNGISNASRGNKENCSPSPTKSLYPSLPRPPPPLHSPLRATRANTSSLNSAHFSPDLAKRPGQTPKTSRKRRALAALINSPPRPSYADKVRGIYRDPVAKPKLHRWDGFGKRRPMIEILDPDVQTGAAEGAKWREEVVVVPWSPLETESEPEVKWDGSTLRQSTGSESADGGVQVDEARSSIESLIAAPGHATETVALTLPQASAPEPTPRNPLNEADEASDAQPSAFSAQNFSVEDPLRELEEACDLGPVFSPPFFDRTNIPQIQEPMPTYDDSSDSWTGDDEFLPRSARRQKRIDLRTSESPKPPHAVSTQLLRPQAPAYMSPNYPWPTPLSKPSRFKAATPLTLYPQGHRSPGRSASDHRASDADDEDSASS